MKCSHSWHVSGPLSPPTTATEWAERGHHSHRAGLAKGTRMIDQALGPHAAGPAAPCQLASFTHVLGNYRDDVEAMGANQA